MAQILMMKREAQDHGQDHSEDAEQPRYEKLRRQSSFLSILITGILALYAAYNAAFVILAPTINGEWIHLGPGAQMWVQVSEHGEGPPGSVSLSSFSLWQRIGFALVLALRAVPVGITLFNLQALFRLYAAGIVFARENASHIKNMGVWLMIFAATPYVTHEISVPIGNNFDNEWFHMEEVYALIVGAILYVVAQVMQVGQEIERERDEFV